MACIKSPMVDNNTHANAFPPLRDKYVNNGVLTHVDEFEHIRCWIIITSISDESLQITLSTMVA